MISFAVDIKLEQIAISCQSQQELNKLERTEWYGKLSWGLYNCQLRKGRCRLENCGKPTTWVPLFFVTTRNRGDLEILWSGHYSKCPKIGKVSSNGYYTVVRPRGNQGCESCTGCKAELSVKILIQKWKDLFSHVGQSTCLSSLYCKNYAKTVVWNWRLFWTKPEHKN